MADFFDLISYILDKVFLNFNYPFVYIFGGYFVLGLIFILYMLIFGDR